MFKSLFVVLSLMLIHSSVFANCKDLSGPEARECKKSKSEEARCKGAVKKVVSGMTKVIDRKTAGQVISDCMNEMKDFCEDRSFYKGCKIDAGSTSCTLWKMNETRTESEDQIQFPKKMKCMKKYSKYL